MTTIKTPAADTTRTPPTPRSEPPSLLKAMVMVLWQRLKRAVGKHTIEVALLPVFLFTTVSSFFLRMQDHWSDPLILMLCMIAAVMYGAMGTALAYGVLAAMVAYLRHIFAAWRQEAQDLIDRSME